MKKIVLVLIAALFLGSFVFADYGKMKFTSHAVKALQKLNTDDIVAAYDVSVKVDGVIFKKTSEAVFENGMFKASAELIYPAEDCETALDETELIPIYFDLGEIEKGEYSFVLDYKEFEKDCETGKLKKTAVKETRMPLYVTENLETYIELNERKGVYLSSSYQFFRISTEKEKYLKNGTEIINPTSETVRITDLKYDERIKVSIDSETIKPQSLTKINYEIDYAKLGKGHYNFDIEINTTKGDLTLTIEVFIDMPKKENTPREEIIIRGPHPPGVEEGSVYKGKTVSENEVKEDIQKAIQSVITPIYSWFCLFIKLPGC